MYRLVRFLSLSLPCSFPCIVSSSVLACFVAMISFVAAFWTRVDLLGVVRVLIQDDQFEDYYFPKGTRFSPPHVSIPPSASSLPSFDPPLPPDSPHLESTGLDMRLIVAWVRSVLVRDPDVYHDDPMRFYPERFLTEDVAKPLAGHWAFGAGRRGLVPLQPQTIHCFMITFPFSASSLSVCGCYLTCRIPW